MSGRIVEEICSFEKGTYKCRTPVLMGANGLGTGGEKGIRDISDRFISMMIQKLCKRS